LRQADVAMYAAKQTGCGTVAYQFGQDDNSRTRLTLLTELRQAIALNQLVLYFQPKLDLMSGDITGVEALVRWQHPERGLLLPAEFIPAAESTSLIHPLTDRVLELALAEARVWQDQGQALQVAVNVSARSLLDTELPSRIRELLTTHGLPAQALRVEITETSLIADPDAALAVLTELAAAGVRLSIDDYGTGYSSMEYLRRLPVDELKVDRAFTAAMSSSESDAVIVRAAIDLGHNLGMRVVAEGVESEDTLRTLADASCDSAQGYHIARPMPASEFQLWIHETRNRASRETDSITSPSTPSHSP
jgi:EAL domain-containing protein (putative c-di-GMP-specific phosphodiesterase class I)